MPSSPRPPVIHSRKCRCGCRGALRQVFGRLQLRVRAGVAQLVEHLICNQAVGGSNPFASSSFQGSDAWRFEPAKESLVVPARSSLPPQRPTAHLRLSGFAPYCVRGCEMERAGRRNEEGPVQQDAQVAEWLMAADCKSAALCATEVRILPCAPVLGRFRRFP